MIKVIPLGLSVALASVGGFAFIAMHLTHAPANGVQPTLVIQEQRYQQDDSELFLSAHGNAILDAQDATAAFGK